jgi:hypothetical protein
LARFRARASTSPTVWRCGVSSRSCRQSGGLRGDRILADDVCFLERAPGIMDELKRRGHAPVLMTCATPAPRPSAVTSHAPGRSLLARETIRHSRSLGNGWLASQPASRADGSRGVTSQLLARQQQYTPLLDSQFGNGYSALARNRIEQVRFLALMEDSRIPQLPNRTPCLSHFRSFQQ